MTNALYYGDNLTVLREHIAEASVDLVYLDPPFNSNATYNVLFRSPKGGQAEAQIEAFEDTWHWGEEAEAAFDEVMQSGHTDAAEMLRAMRGFLRENDMMAYLAMMAVRLIELHRVLKPTGSFYLHCDPTASHYLKILLDAIFEAGNFLNEIIWKRTFAHGSAQRFGPVHDVIFMYSRSSSYVWTNLRIKHDPRYIERHFRMTDEDGRRIQAITLTGAGVRKGESGLAWRGINPTAVNRHWALPGRILQDLGVSGGSVQERLDALDSAGLIYWPRKEGGTPRLKVYADQLDGTALSDVWIDIPPISAQAQERLGYPTQKPLALLERIVQASSNPGDLVLDPFCGCGTTVHAAQKLGRRWIGIDITHLAISLIERRLGEAFPGIDFTVHGQPKTLQDAQDLARRDKHQFEWWAVSVVGAVPAKGKKKGADRGIDGLIYFKPDGRTTEVAVVSVKGGEHVGVGMIRDLRGVMERERAPIGVFITQALPSRQMEKEAASAGFFECDAGKFPRLQIVTLAELFQGKLPRIPLADPTVSFRKAPRERVDRQGRLGV